MPPKLKPLSEQQSLSRVRRAVSDSATARMAAHRGANVVAVARNEEALCELVDELNASGRRATYAIADVADEEALARAARTANERFGSIDTWVNNAGTSIYGRRTGF